MKIITKLLLITILVLTTQVFAASLYNYLGTGNPRLKLELSEDNGPKWGSYTIDYQSYGNVPWNETNNWSPWNVKDEQGNYYGTITLTSNDGEIVAWSNYSAPEDTRYYLKGINFCLPYSISPKCPYNPNYSLNVDEVFTALENQPAAGPFPDAPLASAPSNFNLKVVGNKIYNGSTEVTIKGIVRPSLEWNKEGQFLSIADIANIKKFGANTIRLNLNADYWNNSADENTKGSYRQIINAIIYYATLQNMLIILDYHWPNDQVKQANLPPRSSATTNFWTSVANKYKTFGNVLFELYNEPTGIDINVWLNGDSNYEGMQAMYDTVRKTGSNNLVIINGGSPWGYDLASINKNKKLCNNSTTDCFVRKSAGSQELATNVIYGSHPYNRTIDFSDNFAGVKDLYPIIATEFGSNQANEYPNGWQNIYKNTLDVMDKNKVNYTAFAWWIDSTNPAFPTLIEGSWDNPKPLYGGTYIKDDLTVKLGTVFNFTK